MILALLRLDNAFRAGRLQRVADGEGASTIWRWQVTPIIALTVVVSDKRTGCVVVFALE
jgi:hypothetical protein